MSETHVVSALRAKRAEISGYIHALEKKVSTWRARLAHIDEAIRVFSPDTDPEAIPPKRLYRRTRYFARGELSKRCLETLRNAKGAPVTATAIAKAAMKEKGLPVDDPTLMGSVTDMTLTILRQLSKRGSVVKSGTSRNAQWALAPSLL